MKKFPFLFLYVGFFFFCLMPDLKAQKGGVSAGGELSGSQGFVSFSLGQVSYSHTTSADGAFVNEGLQQPYEISVEGDPDIEPGIWVYQNLTSDFIILDVQYPNIENMYYTLSDIQGKFIAKQTIVENNTSIYLTELANAIYFINVYGNADKKLKTFKIVKN